MMADIFIIAYDYRADQKIFDMLSKISSDTYIAESNLSSYLNKSLFEGNNFGLVFFKYEHPAYHQLFDNFIPGLSIVDLLFNEGSGSENIIKSNNNLLITAN